MADKPQLKGEAVPSDIRDRTVRGKQAASKDQDLRKVCVKFWQNEPYWYQKAGGGLGVLGTAVDAVDKSSFRIRNKYNLIHAVVEAKVSAASQHVPGYEVDPASDDQDDIAQSRISQQVAFWGYDEWRMRRARIKWITNALVQREGFLRPYIDENCAPFKQVPVTDEQGLPVFQDGTDQPLTELRGTPQVKILSLNRSEVIWEPGMDFEESPWHAVVRAFLKDEVKRLPGYVGGDIAADARVADLPTEKQTDKMTVLTEYLERPCKEYPRGRRCFIANDRIVVDARNIDPRAPYWWEDYPSLDNDGNVTDDLVIHRLSYTVDPEGDDRGLVEQIIDLQRTFMDCWNKLLEIKNRALLPQMITPKGSNMPRRDDTPGATYEYNPVGGQAPQWENAIDPGYVNQLIQLKREAEQDLRALSSDVNVQPQPDLAARTAQSAVEQAQLRWQSFLADLAEADSRLMRHCLTLVAQNFDEERIIRIRGQYGWEPPISFTGQDLRSQMNIRVLPGSLETTTRQSRMDEIQMVQTLWPGALSPEMAMAHMSGGQTGNLFKTYELHVARAWSLIQKLRTNPQAVMSAPPRMDGGIVPGQIIPVPAWMPREQDNVVVWKQVIGDYMITPDFENQPPETQFLFDQVWRGLKYYEQMKMMQMQAVEQNVAADLGAANAAKPQGQIAAPQMQGMSREQAAPAASPVGG